MFYPGWQGMPAPHYRLLPGLRTPRVHYDQRHLRVRFRLGYPLFRNRIFVPISGRHLRWRIVLTDS
ncbi:hypothetical protein M408DRAFT_232699 [Serendipita vermifera MAFF 305830]|uniref:Uncharacterized protein n=1 Tax=Serendipita vermifera MAFF 305830 TaxID=933852 RepID=A0A0C3AX42_SERVB|nr:hypothetical protein M408DRAFT_232699 [Serendipita vermifera MAFF 305830]